MTERDFVAGGFAPIAAQIMVRLEQFDTNWRKLQHAKTSQDRTRLANNRDHLYREIRTMLKEVR